MAWFSNYDRDYDRAAGYSPRARRQTAWGGEGAGRGGTQWGERGRWGTSYERPGYGGESVAGRGGYSAWRQPDTPFGSNRYGYDYMYRRRPEESPTYGRGGDQAVQRWARRYGYDLEYEIEPGRHQGGIQRGYEQGRRGGYGGGARGYASRGREFGYGYGRDFGW